MNTSFNDFINYCLSFYGPKGLYDQGRTKEQVAYATTLYLDAIAHYDSDVYTWGDGDSLDRERVRDVMNQIYDGEPPHDQFAAAFTYVTS
tara:strand:- start:298 stop:567 length:270 start_codon:yes stop_codon:yes gene_type:complete